LSHIEVQGTRRPLGSGEVGAALFFGLKYCILTALATGGYAVVIGSTRASAVASEFGPHEARRRRVARLVFTILGLSIYVKGRSVCVQVEHAFWESLAFAAVVTGSFNT
jgi:hypothetical protein